MHSSQSFYLFRSKEKKKNWLNNTDTGPAGQADLAEELYRNIKYTQALYEHLSTCIFVLNKLKCKLANPLCEQNRI